ncbi:hypothetical protein [Microbacterium aurantiacum]|uniref:hypothetical protein n=1 Tax=Microbacterium aurantiacum TaxID=162393 RepID=UPI001FE771F9|nr:hypothetical protein [Microbacterium aurantiacum]
MKVSDEGVGEWLLGIQSVEETRGVDDVRDFSELLIERRIRHIIDRVDRLKDRCVVALDACGDDAHHSVEELMKLDIRIDGGGSGADVGSEALDLEEQRDQFRAEGRLRQVV